MPGPSDEDEEEVGESKSGAGPGSCVMDPSADLKERRQGELLGSLCERIDLRKCLSGLGTAEMFL